MDNTQSSLSNVQNIACVSQKGARAEAKQGKSSRKEIYTIGEMVSKEGGKTGNVTKNLSNMSVVCLPGR